jgi:hypothetical protein
MYPSLLHFIQIVYWLLFTCTERIGIFFCFILFISLRLFIRTLAKMNVPKLNLELVIDDNTPEKCGTLAKHLYV